MRRGQVRESAPGRGSSKFKGLLGRRECREQEEDGDDVRSRRGEVFELGTRNRLRCTGGSTGSSSHAQETLGAGVWSPAVVSRARGEYGTVF